MNFLDRINELNELLTATHRARAVCAQKRQFQKPRATQVFIHGPAMVQVKDADTGRVLGFRRNYQDACTLANQLERGELCA